MGTDCNCSLSRFEDDPCPVHGPDARCEACGSLMVSPTGESHTISHCVDYLRAALHAANRECATLRDKLDLAREALVVLDESQRLEWATDALDNLAENCEHISVGKFPHLTRTDIADNVACRARATLKRIADSYGDAGRRSLAAEKAGEGS